MSKVLGLGLALAEAGEGLERGRVQAREEANLAEQRKFSRQRAYQEAEIRNRQLHALPTAEQSQQANELVAAQTQDALNQLAKRDSYDAFTAYRSDGDTSHLNRAFNSNSILKRMYKIAAVDKINLQAEEDRRLLVQSGIASPEELTQMVDLPETNIDLEKFSRRFVKVTDAQGQRTIRDMSRLYAGTGYTNYLSKQQREALLEEANIAKALRTSEGVPPTLLRESTAVAEARERIERGEGTTEDFTLVEGWTERVAGNVPAKLELADNAASSLIDAFGGDDMFWETDFSDPKNFRKAFKYINQIERLSGTELTNQDKRAIEDVRVLLAIGDPASTLTAEETGIWDKFLNDVKQYVSDEVPGAGATSAYAAFRNSVRHALYGAALTEAEIKAFNEAFGTLGQQLGPVLTKFKTALLQTKAKLDSLAQVQNPVVAHVRLGVDQQHLGSMIESLQERIDYFNSQGKVGTAPQPRQPPQAQPQGKRSMTDIFGG